MYSEIAIAITLLFLPISHASFDCPWKVQGEYYCGSDGKTYTSFCAIKKAIINDGNIQIMHKGSCNGYVSTEDISQSEAKDLNKEHHIKKVQIKKEEQEAVTQNNYQSEETSKDVKPKVYTEGADPDETGKDKEDISKEIIPIDKSESEQYNEPDKSMKPRKINKGKQQRPPKYNIDDSELLGEFAKKKRGKNKRLKFSSILDTLEEQEEKENSSAGDPYSAELNSDEVPYKPKPKPKRRPKPWKPRKQKNNKLPYYNVHVNIGPNNNHVNIGSRYKKKGKNTINNKSHNKNQV